MLLFLYILLLFTATEIRTSEDTSAKSIQDCDVEMKTQRYDTNSPNPTQIQLKEIFAETLGPEAASSGSEIVPLILAYYEPLKITGKNIHGIAWLGSDDALGAIDESGRIQAFYDISEHGLSKFYSNTNQECGPLPFLYWVFYSQSGSLLSINSNGILKQWSRNLATKTILSVMSGRGVHYEQKNKYIYKMSFSYDYLNSDYATMAPAMKYTSQRIHLDTPKQKEFLRSITLKYAPSQILYSPYDETYAFASGARVSIQYIENLQTFRTLNHATMVMALAYAPSPNQIAVAHDNAITIWNYVDKRMLHSVKSCVQHIKAIEYTSDNSIMMLGADDNNTFLAEWNITQRKETQKFTFENATYHKLSLSSNKSRIALWGTSGLQLVNLDQHHSK